MIAGEVVALMRRVFSGNVLLDVNQIEQLRRLLEEHEANIRHRCADIARRNIDDQQEADMVAEAILKDQA